MSDSPAARAPHDAPDRSGTAEWWLWCVAIAVVGFVTRIVVDQTQRNWMLVHGDARTSYARSARRIASAGLANVSSDHPPLHQLVLGLIARVGLVTDKQLLIGNAIVGSLTVVVVAVAARKMAGPTAGLIAAAIGAVYVYFWVYDSLLLSETTAQLVIAVLLLASVTAAAQPTVPHALWLGVAIAAATLTRPEFLLTLGVVPLLWWTAKPDLRRAWLTIGPIALVTAVAFAAPWSIQRTEHGTTVRFGTTNAAQTLAAVNCPTTYSGTLLGYKDLRCLTLADQQIPAFGSEGSDSGRAKIAGTYISDHKLRLPLVYAARVGRAVDLFRPMQQSHFDEEFESHGARWLVALGYAQWQILLPFAIFGVIIYRRRGGDIWTPLALAAISLGAIAITFGNTRYRAPIEPILVVFAAIGAATVVSELRRVWPDRESAGGHTTGDRTAEVTV